MDVSLMISRSGLLRLLCLGVFLCVPCGLNAQEVRELRGHNGAVMMAVFARDAERIVTASTDLQAMLWDVGTGTPLQTFGQHTGPLYTLAVSGDGQSLVTGSQDNTVRLWDLPLRLPLRRLQEAGPSLEALSITADGMSVVGAGSDGMVRLLPFGGAVGSSVVSRPAHAVKATATAVRADGAMFATADVGGRILLWTPDIETPVGRLMGHGGPVARLIFPAGNQQLMSVGDDGLLRFWQLPVVPERILWTATSAVKSLEVLPGQNTAMVITVGQPVRVVNLQSGDVLAELTSAGADILRVASSGAAWSAMAAENGEVRIVNRADGAILGRFGGHTGPVSDLLVAADNQRLVTADSGGNVRMWRVPMPSRPLQGHAAAIRGIVASQGGQWTLTYSDDKTLRVWNSASGAAQSFSGHEQVVTCASIRGDETQVASGDAQGDVCVWNPVTAALEGRVRAHATAIRALVYSPDGTSLVTADAEGLLRGWKLPLPAVAAGAGTEPPQPLWELRLPDNDVPAQLEGGAAEFGLLVVPQSGTRLLRIQWDGTLANLIDSPGGAIRTVDLASAGNVFLATTETGVIHRWAMDLKLQGSMPAHPGLVSARWDRTGTWLAVCDQQPRIRILHAETGRVAEDILLNVVPLQADWTTAEQGTLAAFSGGADGLLVQRNLLQMLPPLPQGSISLAMLADQQSLLAGASDGQIYQWKPGAASVEQAWTVGAAVQALSVSGNGQVLGAAGDDGVLHFRKADGTQLSVTPAAFRARSLSLSADGTRAATAGVDGVTRLWDTATGQLLQSFEQHQAGTTVHSVRFLSDNTSLVSVGEDQTVRVMSASLSRVMPLAEGPIRDVVAVSGGTSLLVARNDGTVSLSAVAPGSAARACLTESQKITAVAARPDGQRLAGGSESGQVLIWNANVIDRVLQTLQVEGQVSALLWSSDNSRLAIATTSQAIWVYGASLPGVQPPAELVLWQKLQCDAPVRCLQFSADGRRLLTALEDGRLEEWVCTAPGPRRQYQHGGPVYGVAVTRDGSVTVSASADQSVRVWDNLTGQQKFQLTGHRGPVHAVDLSPDETFAVSSGSDGTLRLWDIVGGRQLKQLITFDQTMYAVAVHPAGTRVAAAGADRRVHVLELPSGAELQTLTGHSDYIHSVTWSPDGKRLLSYGYAGQMKVWDGESGQLIQEQKVGQIGNSARYSPDGRSIVVGNGDGTASVIPAL